MENFVSTPPTPSNLLNIQASVRMTFSRGQHMRMEHQIVDTVGQSFYSRLSRVLQQKKLLSCDNKVVGAENLVFNASNPIYVAVY